MRGLFTIILLLLTSDMLQAQQAFAFSHITTEDGTGLASNLVTSLYQDEKGFIWVGTANGLQRFDGSKFMEMNAPKAGSDNLLHARVSQIIPADGGKLLLASFTLRDFGLFDPSTFAYKKVVLKPSTAIPPRSEYRVWKDSKGDIYLNVQNYGILRYDKKENVFLDDHPFRFPEGWKITLLGSFENVAKRQYWFACDSGLCIYDRASGQMWHRKNNPQQLPILNNSRVQDGLTRIYIDREKRIWLFGLPGWGKGEQYQFCLDSTGSKYLQKDTAGISNRARGYSEYKHFFETRQGDLWIYGFNLLLNFDKNNKRWYFNKTGGENNVNIDYESVFQVFEDKDGNLWVATSLGLYYTPLGSANSSIVNLTLNKNIPAAIFDILELPNGDLWFALWHTGITSTNSLLQKINNAVYRQPPPADWTDELKEATLECMSLCIQKATGKIWIGCNNGVLMIHNQGSNTTEYLNPPECNNSTIRYLVEDRYGQMWMATSGGRIVKWSDNRFTIVEDVGTIVYKLFFDKDGWLWVATREGGLYAFDPNNGALLQHYTTQSGKNSLYSNTGTDIEQLHNNLIAFGGGALHLIDKRTRNVSIIRYEDGLPSNTVSRLRLDEKGFLWIITSNGLCRFNPNNNRFTPYGLKDGIVLAEQTIAADYCTRNNRILFGGGNAVVMFNPTLISANQKPPDVTITDFKIANKLLAVDSLLQNPVIQLTHDQNNVSISFSALSYRQRDKLAYYYKLSGIDKDWVKADRTYQVNYSLLPPGRYSFKIYCENIEGTKSQHVTEFSLSIRPPFYRTYWFFSSVLFVLAFLIYGLHKMRVNRILAVENLRTSVARDLHDDMGSTLSTINILSSMAKSKMNTDNTKTSEYLGKISEYSERMMDAMDDIVWSIKPANDSMQKITARMREFATNVLEVKEIDFDFNAEEGIYDVKLNMAARRDFFLIFKEAVNNAAKYSQAAKVVIDLQMNNKKLVLQVRDNGIGFDLARADGNGLGNIEKRAESLNGEVVIQSKKGEGTLVKLAIPVTK